MTAVRCPTCHRQERWSGDEVEVLVEGGARRPSDAPTLAAWRILRAARRGETGAAVGPCDACGLPMLSSVPGPCVDWTLDTPEGRLEVGARIVGPDGELSDAEADAWLTRQFRHRVVLRPVTWAFQGTLMSLLLVPLAVWVAAILVLVVFLSGLANGSWGG